uniref:Uncharacterized protein n=1 Tax=Avena sativa TaxID=4498 RepID=A0ACD5UE08_AVESA
MAQGHKPIPPKKTMGTLFSGMNSEQKNRAICTKVKDFSTQLADQIANLYAHLSKNGAQSIFRSKTESLPKRKYILGQTYASNPWMNGNPPPPPVTSTDTALLVDHIRNKSVEEVRSIWIEHAEPRTILVDGLTIRHQLVGNVLLGHELGSVIIRRLAQLDKESENECPYLSFKHVMELDFSTLTLAEEDIVYVDHIQKQFIQDNLQHRIETCQFIFVPAILKEGWSVYMWDMLSRVIHVLDPRSGPYGYNGGKKERHELIASRLHDALFNCLSEFFAGWPIMKDGWETMFPRITDTYFTSFFNL